MFDIESLTYPPTLSGYLWECIDPRHRGTYLHYPQMGVLFPANGFWEKILNISFLSFLSSRYLENKIEVEIITT